MMRKRSIGFMAAGLALVLAGCARVEQPDVWLDGARVASLGLSGGVVDVRLSIHNPNRFAIRAAGLTYDLAFQDPDRDLWIDIAAGRFDRTVEVGARDTVTVVVPVDFTYRGLGEVIRGLLDRGAFDYRVSGVVSLEAPVRRDIRYRHAGSVTQTGLR